MFGVRYRWSAVGGLLAPLAFTFVGNASESQNVVIVSADASDDRLARALVLIRGELSALDVQVRVAEPTAAPSSTESERLTLDVKDGLVVLRAFAPGAPTPLVESVEPDGPEVNAEVIAVRAVEVLRAARLLPAEAPKITAAQPNAVPKPNAPHAPAAPRELAAPAVQLALGPSLVQNSRGLPQLGGHASVRIGLNWCFIAAEGETSLSSMHLERAAGTAQVTRQALFLQVGGRLRLRGVWEVSARSGLGYLHYTTSGAARPGYLDRDLQHRSTAVSVAFGGAYYFVRAFGVYLDLSGVAALDAARIRVNGENAVTLDRPSVSVGAGAVLSAF